MVSDINKLYIANFIWGLHFFGAIMIPFFVEWGGLNFTQITLIQAWFMFWVFLFEMPTGVIADRFGRKNSLAISGVVLASACVAYTIAPEIIYFLIAELLFAFGLSLYSGADRALIYDRLKELGNEGDATGVFSRYHAFGVLGYVIGLPFGSFMAAAMIWPYPNNLVFPFFITFVPYLIYAAFSLTLKEPKRRRLKDNPIRMGIKGMSYLARHKKLRMMALDFVVIAAMCWSIYYLYQPLLGLLGFDIMWYGIIAAAFNAVAFYMLLRVGKIEKRFGPGRVMFVSAIAAGMSFLLSGIWTIIWVVIPTIFIVTTVLQIRRPVFDHYMNKHIEKENRATVLSAVSMIQRIATAVMYLFLGVMMDASLSYALLVMGVLTLFFALTLRSEVG